MSVFISELQCGLGVTTTLKTWFHIDEYKTRHSSASGVHIPSHSPGLRSTAAAACSNMLHQTEELQPNIATCCQQLWCTVGALQHHTDCRMGPALSLQTTSSAIVASLPISSIPSLLQPLHLSPPARHIPSCNTLCNTLCPRLSSLSLSPPSKPSTLPYLCKSLSLLHPSLYL